MASKTICAKMTEYKVVQNAGISLTKGACVTLEVFYTEMYKNQYLVIDGSLQNYQQNRYWPPSPNKAKQGRVKTGGAKCRLPHHDEARRGIQNKNRDKCMHQIFTLVVSTMYWRGHDAASRVVLAYLRLRIERDLPPAACTDLKQREQACKQAKAW